MLAFRAHQGAVGAAGDKPNPKQDTEALQVKKPGQSRPFSSGGPATAAEPMMHMLTSRRAQPSRKNAPHAGCVKAQGRRMWQLSAGGTVPAKRAGLCS